MPSRPTAVRRLLAPALAVAVGVLGILPLTATPASAATLPGLEGTGAAADPLVLDTVADLDAVTAAVNTEPATYGALAYQLATDLDYAGATYDGMAAFSGVFDGAGHTISNLTYSNAADSVGFFRSLTGATVTGLTLSGVSASTATGDGSGALIATVVADSRVVGNTVLDSTVRLGSGGAVNTQAGGLVASTSGTTVISDNTLWNVSVTGHKYAAGLATFTRAGTTIARNLLVDVTVLGDAGGAGATAALVLAQGGSAATTEGNVVVRGAVSKSSSGTVAVGPAGMTETRPNLVSTATSIRAGSVPGQEPTRATLTPATEPDLPDLTDQSTYEGLGWDFTADTGAWRWETEVVHPATRLADLPPLKQAGVPGAGTPADPFRISSAAALDAMAAAISAAPATYADDSYQLSADIDYEGATFPGLDTFSGDLNGAGHTVSDIVYGPSATSADLGLVRRLSGSVRSLRLTGVTLAPTAATEQAAGLAITVTGTDEEPAAIELSEVEATLEAPGVDTVAGLVAEASGSTDLRTNVVDVTVAAERLAGGLVGALAAGARVEENLVTARVTAPTAGGVAATSGGEGTTLTRNVVHGGSVSAGGRVIGDDTGGASVEDNLADTAVTVAGATVTGPGAGNRHGTDATAEMLRTRSTYVGLGWSFIDTWRWDTNALIPVIKYVTAAEQPNRITNTFHGDPMTRRAFTWYQAVAAEEPGVLLSTDPTFADSATTMLAATEEDSEDGETIYRAVASGLTPGLTYHYRVGDNHTGLWSDTGRFITPRGEGDFTFIDLTDTQARGAGEAAVSAATLAKSLRAVPDAEFMVHNGDVVQTGEEETEWKDLFAASQKSLLATTIAPVAGNHDLATNAFTDHFTLEHPNGQDTSNGAYYSYDYNGVHFVMLNTNEGNDRSPEGVGDVAYEPLSDDQLEWVRSDVTAARERGADWIVLTTHKGPYSAADHPTEPDAVSLRERLVPLIDELDIDLVLQGHDHFWSRTQVLVSDPDGVAGAAPVPTDVITEVVGGIHVDYKVDPQGTVYVLPGTAGTKHYPQMTQTDDEFDLESYFDLFERLGGGLRWGNAGESFLEVQVTDERLTLNRYEIVGRGEPTFAEGFGIDRQVTPVDDTLAALPDAASVTLADEPAVAAARQDVKALTKAQRAYLAHLDRLRAAEEALRVLRHTVTIDGSEVAWADATAVSRMPITVRNDQRRDLTDVPVRLALTETPDVDASTLALTTSRSVPVSFEVETWQPGGTSVVWAKVPELAKVSQQVVWAYFGGDGAVDNDPTDVWSDEFELVEHFAADTDTGGSRPDSSGTTSGTLVGAPLTGEVAGTLPGLPGGMVSRFDASRLQYGGNLGRHTREFTVSGVYALSQTDLDAITGVEGSLLGKQVPGAETPTLTMGAVKASGQARTRTPFGGAVSDVPVDGEPHLVTMTFDGMTYAVFVDGKIVHEQMAEGRQFPDQPGVLTAIGDSGVDPTTPDALLAPFHGTADELWVASTEFIPEYDAFRADNYFGDAVVLGEAETKVDAGLTLALGSPGDGTAVEAGLVDVFGSLTKRSTVRVEIAGEQVLSRQVDAGTFTLPVPVTTAGDAIELEFTATAVAEPTLVDTGSLTLAVTDSTAPADPLVSDVRPAGKPLTLTVQPRAELAEKVDARFFSNPSVPLDASNVVVRTGSTTDRVPTSLTPASGAASAGLTPTTVGEDRNPYQIYRVALTPEQAAESEWHFSWRGTADDRTVSAWVWNTATSAWVLKEAKADAEGGQVNLDVRATADDDPVAADGTMSVLVWRGLTELPWGEDRDYDNTLPSPDDYDWSFNHVGDTQLYAEATPWTMTEQFEYIRDHADERKTELVLQAGDWVNREEYEDEWQWRNGEPSARILEAADIPLMISWGNHDYNTTRNGRQMLAKYFPMERFEAGLEGSPWSLGGSHDIDNYYYTGEIAGAKLLMLEVGYWSADSDDDPAFAWAQGVIEAHPDHTVILATHDYLVASGGGGYSNPRINTLLVDPYPNVKLVLTGHNSGTFVSSRTNSGGTRVFGILTDYQTRAWGGHGFLKNLSIDAENGLIHVNTYSPWLQTTTSDGRWNSPIEETSTPGFHGDNAENYVLELDLGGIQTRTLSTDRLTFSAGVPEQLGDTLALVGSETGSVQFSPDLGVGQEWYAVLTDASGNMTTSATRTVRRMQDYPITYDLAGGTNVDPNPDRYTADDDPISLVAPTRSGYEFAGWTGTGLSVATPEVTIPTGSSEPRSYVATWHRIDYPITYDLAGGVLPRLNPATYHVESGATTLLNPMRGGHEFVGWLGTDLGQPATSVTIAAGSTGARTYTAVWSTAAPTAVDTTVRVAPIPTGTYGVGTPVTVTVVDAATGSGVAAGQVVLGGIGDPVTARLVDGRATLQAPALLGAGRRVVTVTYTGTGQLRPSVTSRVLTVDQATGPSLGIRVKGPRKRVPRVALAVRSSAGVVGPTRVRVVATRRAKGRTRSRTVTVTVPEGRSLVRLPKGLAPGRWKVRATYTGNADVQASTSRTVVLRVRR